MARPSKRELQRKIERLEREHAAATPADDVTVAWADAAPDARPEGLRYDADTGRLIYDVWVAQQDCLDALAGDDADIVAFLAGYGSGKSVFGARWLLATALANPGSRFLAMGVDFQKARQTTYPKLFAQLPGERTTLTTSGYNGPENSPIVEEYHRSDHQLILTNDAVIVLGSADTYSRYAGAEFGAVWMDEPSHYGDDLHDLTDMITTRLRGVAGPKTQLWTLTGEGYNAAWEILEQRQDADGEPIGLDIAVVTASVLDNPYLAAGEKDRFRRKYEGTPKEAQALHGGFAAAQGLVYSQFTRETHVIPHSEAIDRVGDDWRVYGYDAGWNDPRVLLEIGKTSYDQLVVVDEYHDRGSHVEDAIAWLTAHDKPPGTIYCEHEPEHVDKFRRAGYRARTAEKAIDPGIAEVRKRLDADGNLSVHSGTSPQSRVTRRSGRTTPAREGCEQVGRGHSSTVVSPTRPPLDESDGSDEEPAADSSRERRVGLLVTDNCEHLVREFLGYKTEHVGKTDATDHCLDALRYACMGVAGGGERRTIPSTW